MKLRVLGSGTILSSGERNPAGYILETDTNMFLIDAGPGILRRLDEYYIDLEEITGIFLSHFHLDHCSDVMAILMKRYLGGGSLGREMFIAGSEGLFNWFKTMASLQGSWLRDRLPELINLEIEKLKVNNLEISCTPTGHTEESIALRFDSGQSLFYSSDTDFSEQLAAFALNADVGIVECSHEESNKKPGHMVPSETAKFARLANLNHLIVTHLYPENEHNYLQYELEHHFDGKITIAFDGLLIDI